MPSPFDALIDDLMAVQERRTTQTPSRDTVSRIARHAAESARNRRLQQMQQQPRRLAKSAPVPDYRKPDWDSLSARQDKIAAEMEQTRIEQQKQAIRAHIATLMAAAKAGRLDPHSVCVLDVLRGRADSMGIAP